MSAIRLMLYVFILFTVTQSVIALVDGQYTYAAWFIAGSLLVAIALWVLTTRRARHDGRR